MAGYGGEWVSREGKASVWLTDWLTDPHCSIGRITSSVGWPAVAVSTRCAMSLVREAGHHCRQTRLGYKLLRTTLALRRGNVCPVS